MMSISNAQTRLIIILAAVLLAVAAASGVLLWLLPNNQDGVSVPDATSSASPGATTTADGGFDTKVLHSTGYSSLDPQPVIEGTLPVRPPLTPGKANPFL